MYVKSFAPLISHQAQLIILGSMPGIASLQHNQYYAHPRNGFWPIMLALLDAQAETYEQRTRLLIRHGIAVWDVLKSCQRIGSLDANIQKNSMQVNDFNNLFSTYPTIQAVFFNGATAENLYQRAVLTHLDARFSHLNYQRLPSTSPAHASMSLQQKKMAWTVLNHWFKPST